MPKFLIKNPIPKLNYLGFWDTLCHHDQPTHSCISFSQALMGLIFKIMQTLQFLNPNPLVILLQLVEKFHNWVKYGQWTLHTNGCLCTTSSNSSTSSNGSNITNASISICQTNAKNCRCNTWGHSPPSDRNIIGRPI